MATRAYIPAKYETCDEPMPRVSDYYPVHAGHEMVVQKAILNDTSRYWYVQAVFGRRESELKSLKSLAHGWDSYEAEPPSSDAIKLAGRFLNLLRPTLLAPDRVLASGEGGVALSFYSDNGRDAYIEMLNDGEMHAVLYANGKTVSTPPVSLDEKGASELAGLLRAHRLGHAE